MVDVRNAAEEFAGLDNRYGSGLFREAVIAQLRYCAELLNARCSEDVQAHGEEFARARVMDQIKIASLVMVTGDPIEAAVIGGQALDAAGSIRSHRAADFMRELRRFSEPHQRLTKVAELAQRIGSSAVIT